MEIFAAPYDSLLARAREIAERELAPRANATDQAGHVPVENIRRLAEAGLLGLTAPVDYGGDDAPPEVVRAFLETIANACGVTVFVVMLPPLCTYSQKSAAISTLSWAGAAICLSGLAIETAADFQKTRFREDPKNKDTWIDQGVWRASRHPNYLGEMMVWAGLYVAVVLALPLGLALLALVGPLSILFLLSFISGIPILEKSAERKWGRQKAYTAYKSAVPLLVPTVSSLKRLLV